MKILTYPNKFLTGQAEPVTSVDRNVQGFIDRMFITMYRARGIGLAAPQVGVVKQIVVINLKWNPMILINPVIRHIGPGVWENESCLSIPGYTASIERSSEILVTSHDRHGKEQDFEASGLLARCIQHEVDHLHGVLINSKGD